MSETEWVLDVEGDPEPDPKLNEFRANNIKLLQDIEAERKKGAELQAKLEEREKANKVEPSEKERLAQLERLITEERDARAKAQKQLQVTSWESEFLSAAQGAKVRSPEAAKALLVIAKSQFREKEGVGFVPTRDDGSTIFAPQSDKPLSVQGWIEDKKAGDYKDLFSQPVGGGGRGSNGAVGGGARVQMTRADLLKPTADQFKAAQEGRVDVID